MVTLAFSQLGDLLRKRQRFGKVLEAEDAVEARDVLLRQDLPLRGFVLQVRDLQVVEPWRVASAGDALFLVRQAWRAAPWMALSTVGRKRNGK